MPVKRVVSFSLWGSNTLYCDGALKNLRAMREFYPDWLMRVYYGRYQDAKTQAWVDVPEDTLKALTDGGAEIVKMGQTFAELGLYWRFHAAFDDEATDAMLVRDADSMFTRREVDAVNEWIASGLPFHVIRDNESHATTILGGTWGCRPQWLGPTGKRFADDFKVRFQTWIQILQPEWKHPRGPYCGSDQNFLHKLIWPLVREGRHLAHIRAGMPHLRYTPTDRELPPLTDGHYVGMVC